MPEKLLTPWYWIAVLGLVTAVAMYAHERDLYSLYLAHQNSESEVRMLSEEVEHLALQEAKLSQKVLELQNDPLELEAAIRETKRLVRPGETIYRVSVPEATAETKVQAVP